VISGIPQGIVLGPILFVCFINDMPLEVSSSVHLYADDSKISRRIDNITDSVTLQNDIDNTVKYSEKWQLRFNLPKCKVMHVSNVSNAENHSCYSMLGSNVVTKLTETVVERDLGVWIDNNLKFSVQVEKAVSKANQLLGLIKRSFVYIDQQVMKHLYVAIVRPHLEYGNVVWHPRYKKDTDMLESVQHRATRLVPSLRSLNYSERLRAIELPSLMYRRFRGDAIEVYKYLHGLYKVDSQSLLPLSESSGLVTRGHCLKIQKRSCRTQLRGNFFAFRVVNSWNSMPEEVVTAPSVNCFKGRFDKYWKNLLYETDEDVFMTEIVNGRRKH